MTDHALSSSTEPFLLSAAEGDVLAARVAAKDILAGMIFEDGLASPALLGLTAILLQSLTQDGEGVTRSALLVELRMLCRQGLPGREMARSRLQFCRYAAAEIESLTPMQRCILIKAYLEAATPGDLADPSGDMCQESAREVIY